MLAIAVVGYILFRAASGSGGFDWDRFGAALRSLDLKYYSLSIVFIILSYLGRAIRWEVMIRPLGATASLARLTVATVIGFTAVVLLGRPGEFVRPWLIARESRTSFSSQLAIWLFERIYDLLIVILFFGFGLIHLSRGGMDGKAGPELRMVLTSGGTLALAGGGVCLLFILALRFLSPAQRQGLIGLIDRLPAALAAKLRPVAGNFMEGAAASCDGKLQWLVLFYTLVEWLIIAGCYWAIFLAFPVTRHFSPADVAACVGLVSFGAIVQLPGIGGGMQVAAIAVLTQIFGLGLEDATSVAILLWFTSFTLVLPFGIGFALREGLSFAKMRTLSAEAS
jgi:glycosyltransferase 2 family protein